MHTKEYTIPGNGWKLFAPKGDTTNFDLVQGDKVRFYTSEYSGVVAYIDVQDSNGKLKVVKSSWHRLGDA